MCQFMKFRLCIFMICLYHTCKRYVLYVSLRSSVFLWFAFIMPMRSLQLPLNSSPLGHVWVRNPHLVSTVPSGALTHNGTVPETVMISLHSYTGSLRSLFIQTRGYHFSIYGLTFIFWNVIKLLLDNTYIVFVCLYIITLIHQII